MNSNLNLPTLSQQVRKQMFWLGVLLFFSCMTLLLVFAWRSIDLLSNQLTNLQADALIAQVKNAPNQTFPSSQQSSVFRRWQDLPLPIKTHFKYEQLVIGEIAEQLIYSKNGQLIYVYLLVKRDDKLGELFFVSQHNEEDIEQFALDFMFTAIKNAFWIVVAIFTLLFFIIRWLFYKSAEPLWQLSRWANNLSVNTNTVNHSYFTNQETNLIAQQLSDNIRRIESFNSRERSFLKHASHEFRTPLAIIQASLDTIQLKDPNNRSVQRALRATHNMNRLANSLLWIARESNQKIKKEFVTLTVIIQEILNNLQYLIDNKSVELELNIKQPELMIEKELLIVVLTNLIRNGFEHCVNGKVIINVNRDYFEIVNSFSLSDTDTGFGLGLALTEKICRKFGWQFSFSKDRKIASARISWQVQT